MRRKRPFGGGSSGSGRRGRGSSSGGGSKDEPEEEETPGEDEEEPEEKTTASGRKKRRSGRGGGGGGDDARAAAEEEKKKLQTVLMISGAVGVLLIIVLAVVMGGGSDARPGETTEEHGPAPVKRMETDVEGARALYTEGKNAFDDANGIEDSAKKVPKLELAMRKLDAAIDAIESRRRSCPNLAARGASFDRLDDLDQQVGQTKKMVKMQLAEARQ